MNDTTLYSHEASMLQAGVVRYTQHQERATKHGDLTSAQTKVFTSAVSDVAAVMQKALEEAAGPGRKPAWFETVSEMGALAAAVLTLRIAFSNTQGRSEIQKITAAIGRQVEVERIGAAVKASTITEEMDEKARKEALKTGQKLYDRIVKRATTRRDMLDRSRVFTETAMEQIDWNLWGRDEHVKVGSALFFFVLQGTDIFETYHEGEGPLDEAGIPAKVTFVGVRITDAAAARMDSIAEFESWMRPVYKPMLDKPADWKDAYTGCYEDKRVSSTVKVMSSFNKAHMQEVDVAIRAEAPFAQALNAIQAVPMTVNLTVAHYLEWAYNNKALPQWLKDNKIELKGFPLPLMDAPEGEESKEDKAERLKFNRKQHAVRAELSRTVECAKEYTGYGRFFLPSSLDWRGRVYARPHLNHQREDSVKALFQFSEGQTLTDEGASWLAIHLANCGAFKMENGKKFDKAPMEVRAQWTVENTGRIREMLQDPSKDLWWLESDSPFMFLAACDAWIGYLDNPTGYRCHLPVGVDGSCSGLQHFSAMLRDSIGGSHVNLTPQEEPADIYQVVADAVGPLVNADAEAGDIHAIRWNKILVSRKVTKRCVMTYVYGSKQFGFAQHLAEDFAKQIHAVVIPDMTQADDEEGWQFKFRCERELNATAHYLAKHIAKVVPETVKAAAEAMGWLQSLAGLMASQGLPLKWNSPSGFPVINAYYEPEIERVDLTLWDRSVNIPKRLKPTVMLGNSKTLMPAKCRSSVAPNVVHSLDAAHLHLAVLKAKEEGIKSVMLIHDSFSCLPNDMPRFSAIVRETFVDMYKSYDPLLSLYETAQEALKDLPDALEKLQPPPQRGDLDLHEVLESLYAFA